MVQLSHAFLPVSGGQARDCWFWASGPFRRARQLPGIVRYLSVLPAVCPTSGVTRRKDPGQNIAQLSRETGRPAYGPSNLGSIVCLYHSTLLLRVRCHRQVNTPSLLPCAAHGSHCTAHSIHYEAHSSHCAARGSHCTAHAHRAFCH